MLFEDPTMLVQDADDLRHLRLDAREALVGLPLIFQVTALKLQVVAARLRQLADKGRLVLDEQRHRFFEPIVAVRRCLFSCHGRPPASSIGATGFEPATSWSQTTRSSQTELRPAEAALTLADGRRPSNGRFALTAAAPRGCARSHHSTRTPARSAPGPCPSAAPPPSSPASVAVRPRCP